MTSDDTEVGTDSNDGPLQRHKISPEDHPLSVGKSSAWSQFFQVSNVNVYSYPCLRVSLVPRFSLRLQPMRL